MSLANDNFSVIPTSLDSFEITLSGIMKRFLYEKKLIDVCLTLKNNLKSSNFSYKNEVLKK